MLDSTADILGHAKQHGYAVGAFNVYNLEGARAVISAAEAEGSPVMLQIHPAALHHGGKPLIALCLTAARESSVPVAVHLDHSTSTDDIQLGLDAGMPSIMADGSHLDYTANLAFTKAMATLAHAHSAAIEAELGRISGTEDGLTVAEREARYTDPDQATAFVRETGIDALAVCIGNVHGKYPSEPQLDFDRLAAIRDRVEVPLVLHGASGLPDAMVRRAIELGICKFNVNTELRHAYLMALESAICSSDSAPELADVMKRAESAIVRVVRDKIRLFK